MQKNQTKKIKNFNLWLFSIWVIFGSLTLLVFYKNFYISIFLIIGISTFFIFKFSKKQIIITIILLLIILLFCFLTNQKYNLYYLSKITNQYSLRNILSNYIKNNYNEKTSSFLLMLILNIKSNKSTIFSITNNLNVIHLFVVSGLHISILSSFISFIFKKSRILNFIINQIIILFLFYISGLSISILRVLICFNVRFFNKNKDPFTNNLITGIIINLCFINEVKNLGYLLSIICSLYICFIANKINQKWISFLVINVTTSIIVLPIVNEFNNAFNLLWFFNSLLLSNVILILYFFSLIFLWFPFMIDFMQQLINFIINLFQALLTNESIIQFNFAKCIKYWWYLLLILSYYVYYIKFEPNEIFNYLLNIKKSKYKFATK